MSANRLITRPRIVELPAQTANPIALAPAIDPSISMTGVPAKVGWVVPSIVTGLETHGNSAPSGRMVHVPAVSSHPGSESTGMSKWMVSSPGVEFAAAIASRRPMTPSAPGLALRAEIEDVSPSEISVVESTTTVSCVMVLRISGRASPSIRMTKSSRASGVSRMGSTVTGLPGRRSLTGSRSETRVKPEGGTAGVFDP